MTTDQHRERHVKLHKALDELLADFIAHTGSLPSRTPILELMTWSYEQTQVPAPLTAGKQPQVKEG